MHTISDKGLTKVFEGKIVVRSRTLSSGPKRMSNETLTSVQGKHHAQKLRQKICPRFTLRSDLSVAPNVWERDLVCPRDINMFHQVFIVAGMI